MRTSALTIIKFNSEKTASKGIVQTEKGSLRERGCKRKQMEKKNRKARIEGRVCYLGDMRVCDSALQSLPTVPDNFSALTSQLMLVSFIAMPPPASSSTSSCVEINIRREHVSLSSRARTAVKIVMLLWRRPLSHKAKLLCGGVDVSEIVCVCVWLQHTRYCYDWLSVRHRPQLWVISIQLAFRTGRPLWKKIILD